jgi:hypothetical protein
MEFKAVFKAGAFSAITKPTKPSLSTIPKASIWRASYEEKPHLNSSSSTVGSNPSILHPYSLEIARSEENDHCTWLFDGEIHAPTAINQSPAVLNPSSMKRPK